VVRGKLHYVDPENQYLLNINGENRMVVAFNTKLVNPAEIKSYWDLLNPKWKGKIVAYDPRLGGSGDAMRFSITAKVSGRSSSADSHGNGHCDQHDTRQMGDGWRVGLQSL